MKLYDNDAYREEFMELVYNLLSSDVTNDRANQIIDAFDNAPEVDAALVVHGRWKYDKIIITCSECGKSTNLLALFTHYCPYCGAKMDKE